MPAQISGGGTASGVSPSVAGDGLSESGGVLSVNTDNSTLEKSADALRIKDSGVTTGKLANSAVTPVKTSFVGTETPATGHVIGLYDGTRFDIQYPFAVLHVNVRDHGLVGDDSTDNRAALSTLLSLLASLSETNTVKAVYWPAGVYRIYNNAPSDGISWPQNGSNIHFIGDGMGRSVIATNHAAQCFVLNRTTAGEIRNVRFSRLTFRGIANTDADGAYDIINFRQRIYDLCFDECEFKWFRHAAIVMSATSNLGRGYRVTNCVFREAMGGNSGGAMTGGSGAAIQGKYPNTVISGNDFHDLATNANGHAIYLDDSLTVDSVRIVNNRFGSLNDATTYNDIIARSGVTNGFVFANNTCGPGCRQLQLGGQNACAVTGNTFHGAYIDLITITGLTISGNQFYNGYIQAASGTQTGVLVAGNLFQMTTGSLTAIAVTVTAATRWQVQSNHFITGDNRAVTFYGSYSTFKHNYVYGSATSGSSQAQYFTLLSTANNNLIEDNFLVHAGSGVSTVRPIRDEGTGSGNRAINNRAINIGSGVSTFEIASNNLINQVTERVLFQATASATVANTAVETTLLGAGVGGKTLATDFLKVGGGIRIRAEGVYSTRTAAAGTLELRFKLGSVVICTTAATTVTDNLSNRRWSVDCLLTCRTIGATGTVFGQGEAHLFTLAGTMLGVEMRNTATSTVDTTAAQAVDLTATWGTADAGNTITCTNAILEHLPSCIG